MKKTSVQKIAVTAMFSALAFAAVLLGKWIPNVAGFLSYDPKDSVIAIAGFMLGAPMTLLISLVVSLVEMVSISTTGLYGMIMNFLSTAAFAFPAALLYQKKRSYRGALFGLGLGVVFMTAFMVLWNYIITPFYMGMPRAAVAEMLLPVFFPFNFIKGGINAGLTLVLYKPLVSALRRTGLVKKVQGDKASPVRFGFVWIGAAFLAVFVLAFLIFTGVI